ncbi:S53 family peptidase [Tengunoibacter tsumagoiensis]|uniref:Peptidase S8 n=1 Tax=Tengunoibacter tsumagoiensis TaxID=2014871 RepID=A0A401ZTY0_9CHLR|nr:S53 family peptidase [Tengunoibacter tsumagoiensis]GCE10230.1 peptidase S8 [Tengunoibacter tsumagoiensis]
MKNILRLLTSLFAVFSFAFFGTVTPTFAQSVTSNVHKLVSHHVCTTIVSGQAHCNAILVDKNSKGVTPFASSPGGLNPADLQSAYNLPSSSLGSGQTVAIVDAYDDPNAESDLAVYRAQFGLPECSTANGCFSKVDQRGGTNYPAGNTGWSEEISLDLDMVSAVCPLCNILLVEGDSASFANLGTAVNTAVSLGATTVSNSYGGGESFLSFLYASYYNHPGVIITASTGDSGYGVEVPAGYNTVVGVGGTSLHASSNDPRGWIESAWSGAGSGCTSYESKPTWQSDPDCSHRTIADVSAVADPATGVSVYDTYGVAGWLVFGGTSVSSPIIASVYALAGNASSLNAAESLYNDPGDLNDVTSGSNGNCNGSYLCTAGNGYDGPTGLGTPNGIGAF